MTMTFRSPYIWNDEEINTFSKNWTNNDLKKDYIRTTKARYINPQLLIQFCEKIIKEKIFDKIILVPRGGNEELDKLSYIANKTNAKVLTNSSKNLVDSKIVIIAAKGILRSIYQVTDTVFVLGWHNILEPFFNGVEHSVFFSPHPRVSPNYEIYKLCKFLNVGKEISLNMANSESLNDLIKLIRNYRIIDTHEIIEHPSIKILNKKGLEEYAKLVKNILNYE